MPAREGARRGESKQRRDFGERATWLVHVALRKLAAGAPARCARTTASRASRWRWIVRRSTPRCWATRSIVQVPVGSSITTSSRTRVDMSAALPAAPPRASGARSARSPGSAFGLGISRSLRAQTMPLKSWPNSTLRPNTRSWTRSGRRGRRARSRRAADASRAPRKCAGCGRRRRWRARSTGASRPPGHDQLLAQHDHVAALLDGQEQRLVEALL